MTKLKVTHPREWSKLKGFPLHIRKNVLQAVLDENKRSASQAAREIGVTRQTMGRLIGSHHLAVSPASISKSRLTEETVKRVYNAAFKDGRWRTSGEIARVAETSTSMATRILNMAVAQGKAEREYVTCSKIACFKLA